MRSSLAFAAPFVALVAAQGASKGSSSSGSSEEALSPADVENIRISWYLGYVWSATVAAIFVYYMWLTSVRYVRTLACLGIENQRYFSTPNSKYAAIKRHIIDAPLFRKRHNREFKLSAAVNVGTLPGRLQTMYLVGYIAMNIAFCVVSIDFSEEPKELASAVRNRTGVLAVMNMLPLFLLAGRNNPFISLLGISFDTYNLMHRWIGRIVVLEILAHTLAWMVNTVQTAGWAVVGKAMAGSQLILTGTIVSIFTPHIYGIDFDLAIGHVRSAGPSSAVAVYLPPCILRNLPAHSHSTCGSDCRCRMDPLDLAPPAGHNVGSHRYLGC